MDHQATKTNSLFLSAALAGLVGAPTALQAATVFTESTDFGNSIGTPTDLTSEWGNFVASGGVIGSLNFSSDYSDYFSFNAPAGTVVSVPFSMTTAGSVVYPSVSVFSSSFSQLTSVYYGQDLDVGEEFSGNATFTVPASGVVVFGFSNEGGTGAANYTVGAVPEAGSSVLGLAGLAAAALQRRRRNSP